MSKRRIVVLVTTFAVVCLCVMAFAFAEDKEITRTTLRGIKEVNVVIESIEPEIEKLGLTQAQVRADVEGKLRGANLPVAEQFERGRPAVYLYVQVIRPEKVDRLFYSISLSLLQNVVTTARMLRQTYNIKPNEKVAIELRVAAEAPRGILEKYRDVMWPSRRSRRSNGKRPPRPAWCSPPATPSRPRRPAVRPGWTARA